MKLNGHSRLKQPTTPLYFGRFRRDSKARTGTFALRASVERVRGDDAGGRDFSLMNIQNFSTDSSATSPPKTFVSSYKNKQLPIIKT